MRTQPTTRAQTTRARRRARSRRNTFILWGVAGLVAVGGWFGYREVVRASEHAAEVETSEVTDEPPKADPELPSVEPTLPASPSTTDQQAFRRLLLAADELTRAVDTLPQRYDLTNVTGRQEAAGSLLIHLMTLEDLKVPASVAELWRLRKASVEQSAQALRHHEPNSKETKRLWGEASRLLKESRNLERALRRGAPR